MKKIKICLFILCALAIMLPGCGSDDNKSDKIQESNITDINDSNLKALPVDELTQDGELACGDSSIVSYYEKTYAEYLGACKYYVEQGYEIYSVSEMNGNHFTTLTKDAKRAYVYWIEREEELNIITAHKQGQTMPPVQSGEPTGQTETTVTPIYSENLNEMGYVIQLSDGSFIIYDGGSSANAGKLLDILTGLSGGNDIIVRAWVLTVSLPEHYGCFVQFAADYADQIKLEYVLSAPVCRQLALPAKQMYLTSELESDVAKFEGAKSCHVHTGMIFTFCNVKMEILFTPEEIYVCDQPTKNEYHNTSLVSRISTDTKSIMMLSDSGVHVGRRLGIYYGEYLVSTYCQMSRNGNSDFPIYVYNMITEGNADRYIRTDSSVIVLD